MLKITKNQGSIQVTADKSGFYPFDGTITFPTNSLFTATSANTDMITFKSTSNGDVQFVGNYKDITISGRSYDTKQKFLTAFSNLANQGSVDAYTKAETDAKLNDKLTAKTNAKDALFIRSYSNNDASSSLALYDSTVKGTNDVAIGLASTSSKEGSHNLAMLSRAQANGRQNIVIGDQRRCDGDQNIGIGCGKYDTIDVNGTGNVCVGANSQAHTDNNTAVNDSIAIGSDAKAGANFCTVIGKSAHSKSSHSVAVGDNAYVDHDCDFSVAVGDSATAYGKGCVAIGRTSNATNVKPLDICCGQRTDGTPLSVIQSDENGKISLLKGDGTDERIVIQDALSAGGGGSVDAYTKAETDTKLEAKQDKLTAGTGITITKDETAGTSTIATAVSLTDNGNGAYQVGDSITIDSKSSVRIGKDYTQAIEDITDRVATIAIGYDARTNTTYGKGDIAIGDKAQSFSTGVGSIAIGKDTLAQADSGNSSIAIGSGAKIDRNDANGIAIGSNTIIEGGQNSIVIGNGSDAWGDKGVTIGYNSHTSTNENINIGNNRYMRGDYNLSVGAGAASVGGGYCIAIGYGSVFGSYNASRAHYYDIAIGDHAYAIGTCSLAIGREASASDETPLVIRAGHKTVGGREEPLTMIQSDATGKISLLKGDGSDERIVIQDEIAALKNAGGSGGTGGTVDAYTKAETDNLLNAKQNTLTAGSGITIDENNVISSTGGGGSANPFVNIKGTGSNATIADNASDGIAIGSGASVNRYLSIAIGNSSVTEGHADVVIGDSSRSIGNDCVIIGQSSESTVKNSAGSVIVGANSKSSARYGLAIGQYAEAKDTKPLVIKAGVDGNFLPLTMIQGDENGKISVLLGDGTQSTMCLQDEITALKTEITTLKAEIAALKGGASTGA